MGGLNQVFNQVKQAFHFCLKDYGNGRESVRRGDDHAPRSWSSLLAQNIISRADEWRINTRPHYGEDGDLVISITRTVNNSCHEIHARLYRCANSNGNAVYHVYVNDVHIDDADENNELRQALIYFNDRRIAKIEEQARQQSDRKKSAMVDNVMHALNSE